MIVKERNYEEVFTVEEVAGIFKLSRGSVRNLIKKGEIPAIKIGKQYRIPESIVEKLYSQVYKVSEPEKAGYGMLKNSNKAVSGLEYVRKIRDTSKTVEETLEEIDKWEE